LTLLLFCDVMSPLFGVVGGWKWQRLLGEKGRIIKG